MAEQEKHYRIEHPDGLLVADEKGKEHHYRQGRVLPRGVLLAHPDAQITWLLDQKIVKEVDAPEREQATSSPAGRAVPASPPAPSPDEPDSGEAT